MQIVLPLTSIHESSQGSPFIGRSPFSQHGLHGRQCDSLSEALNHPGGDEYSLASLGADGREQGEDGGGQQSEAHHPLSAILLC